MSIKPLYITKLGTLYNGDSAKLLSKPQFKELKGKVNLIFTSPPFPLARKKKYGNLNGEAYIEWLASYGSIFQKLLTEDGSLVIELGNAWKPGHPVMSLTPIKSLMELKERGNFELCQEFIWYNPSKLPSPAQWVNVERIRVKDAFTRFWWLSKTSRPRADNRRVLKKYSSSMKLLLKKKEYNFGKRPSEHNIGERSFLTNNNGSIPANVLSIPNTVSRSYYLDYCRQKEITPNPSRMPTKVAKFFIEFLTEKGDLVLDPFAGSNVTGYVAEKCERRWISIEIDKNCANSSKYRFDVFRKREQHSKGGRT
jgi:DNA modification methylase